MGCPQTPTSSSVLVHWGKFNHPQLPCLMDRGKSRVTCHAQSSLLVPEHPICVLWKSDAAPERVPREAVRELGCAPPAGPQSPGPTKLVNMATRVTCPHYLASSCTQTSLPHSQIDTETFELWAPAERPGYSICHFQSDSVPKDSLRPHCPNPPAWLHLLLWSPEIWSYHLCLFLIPLFPKTT